MHNIMKQMKADRKNRPNERYVPVSGKAVDEFIPQFEAVVTENEQLKKTVADRDTEIANLREKIKELTEKKEDSE